MIRRGFSRRTFLRLLEGSLLVAGGCAGARRPIYRAGAATQVHGSAGGLRGVRAEFLLPEGFVFMNNGSTGACPKRVLDAVAGAWRHMEQSPVARAYGSTLAEAQAVHERLAAFLGASRREVLPTINTTDAMNLIAQGIELRNGDHVLTTNHEHPGGRYCWEYMAERAGIVIDQIELPMPPEDPGQIVDLLAAKLTPRTRVISVSHVTFTTGLRLPIRSIAELAGRHGVLLVVDGAQVPGAMRVNVNALGCDAYAMSAHKWMLAPKGTGALYVRLASRDSIYPIRTYDGWFVYSGSMGLQNLPAFIGLGSALSFLEELSMERIEAHNMQLRAYLYERLQERTPLRIVSPPGGAMAAPIVSVELPQHVRALDLQQRLLDHHRISVRAVTKDEGFEGLRFTTHVHNDKNDCDRLIAALQAELSQRQG